MATAGCRHRRMRGFSLVELSVAAAVVGIFASVAWPSHLAQAQRARRIDAQAALTQLQQAQEQHRLRHGRYASELVQIGGRTLSAQGLYDLALDGSDPDRVTLVARARADRDQRRDHECAQITLVLNQGVADAGPSGRCWSR